MGLEGGWSDLAQQRDKWLTASEGGEKKWERAKNAKEKEEEEQKKAGSGVKCTFTGCSFIAKNEKGLKSHWSQKHKGAEESSDDDEDGGEETDDEDEDSDDNDDEDAAPPKNSSSSCSSTTPTTKTKATTSSSSSKHRCLHCQKDCTNSSGLSSHLRHSPACKAAADRNK